MQTDVPNELNVPFRSQNSSMQIALCYTCFST